MAQFSFIDFGHRDFLRSEIDGTPITIEASCYEEAEEWLLENGDAHGWTNKGVRYWNWEEEGD